MILIFLLSIFTLMFMLILMFSRMETVGFLRMRRVHVSLLAFFGLIVNFMLRFLSFGLMKFTLMYPPFQGQHHLCHRIYDKVRNFIFDDNASELIIVHISRLSLN